MAITLKHTRPVTDEEIRELSRQNPGYQFERSAKGELIVTPTGSESGRRSAELTYQLQAWNRQQGNGVVFDSSAGFRMADGALLSPDASWVRRERWDALSAEQREGFAPVCPDAVFEVRSPTDATSELRAKMRVYVANGAQVAVLVDPYGRSVEVYRPGQDPQVFQDSAPVALNPELPGFVLDLSPVFTA